MQKSEPRSKLLRMSSSWTLILKLFVPVFWLSFFLPLGIAIIASDDIRQLLQTSWLSIGVFVFLISGVIIFYFTTWRLKRLDVDDQFLYASNYFKTIRFPYAYIQDIQERDLLLFRLFVLELPQKGQLGQKIHFIESGKSFRTLIEDHPERFQDLRPKEKVS